MHSSMDQRSTTEETNNVARKLALLLAPRISDQAVREDVTRCVTDGDFPALCNFAVPYTLDAYSVIALRQILALYQKRADLDIGVDKAESAWNSFRAAEQQCRETNERLKLFSHGRVNPCDRDVASVLHNAQRKIARVLGFVPDIRDLKLRFGPGATTGIPKRMASAKRKLSEAFTSSENLAPFVGEILEEVPGWSGLTLAQRHANDAPNCTGVDRKACLISGLTFLTTVHASDGETCEVPVLVKPGNLVFVPKNAKTYRSVVVEPSLNSFVQLGVGEYIAARLKRVGIDITSQEANQSAARVGSVTGALATLDLSSASDTLSKELVYHLLPIDWALALDMLRTTSVEHEGTTLTLHKFSSMGNGYTFPLETLIFWALSSAASDDDDRVLAYGDDIVVPTEAVPLVVKTLEFCGFTINQGKSFSTGPFRESCGKDYLSGIDVRPVYLKDQVNNFDLFRLHNFFTRNRDEELALAVLEEIPDALRIWGPENYGDGHLVSDSLDHLKAHGRDRGYGGFIFDTYKLKGRRDSRPLPGDYVLPLYSVYIRGESLDLSKHALNYWRDIEDQPFTPHSRSGNPSSSLPGDQGYKRISIYTLSLG